MFKRFSLIGLSLLLALYPTSVMAADTGQEIDQNENKVEEVEVDNIEESVEGAESSDEEKATNEEATVEEESAAQSELDTEEEAEVEVATDDSDNGEDLVDASEEEVATDAEGDASTTQLDEDLDLTKIHGAANARSAIEYDFNKGYYVLDLQAGLQNMSNNQVLTQKWVAFALPNGVNVPDVEDVPAGLVPVTLYDGSNGLAIKIPDVQEFPDTKFVYPQIPLVGEPDDNDPNENLYLFNVNVEERTYEDLGQIRSQRNIDFSVMEGQPDIDMDGSITGDVSFNEENRHYTLDLDVQATNNTGSDLSDMYVGFTLPEDVRVLKNELDVVSLELEDGSTELAVKLPDMKAGGDGEINYQIPIMGKTDAKIQSSTINLYKIGGSGYREIGQIDGSINIDFSNMDVAWKFDAEGQIVKDHPDVDDNQFGLRFAFSTQNLTIDDVDQVNVEFLVPDHMEILTPDYHLNADIPDSMKDFLDEEGGLGDELDIEWDGNTAIINLDTVEGTQWNQGYFTAFGESDLPLGDLEGLKVLVTLYKDGTEVVEEIEVPFEIVSYEGEKEEPEDPEDPEEPEDPEKPGDDDGDNGKGAGDDDGDTDDKDETNGKKDPKTDDDSDGARLPDTATNMFSLILIGSLLTLSGGAFMFFRRKKVA